MLNCYQFKHFISKYLDEEISFKERHAFEEHQQTCPVCQALLINIRRNREALQNLPSIGVSENFMFNLRNRILADRNARLQRALHQGFSLSKVPSFAYGFAVALLAVVVGFVLLQSQSENEPSYLPPPVVQQKINQPRPSPTEPARNLPSAPARQYTSTQSQTVPTDTVSEIAPEPDNRYQDNFQDKIRTVKDQR